MNQLDLERKSLPNEPGVYLFSDKNNNIIYIGKALNLRKRVNQYFTKAHYNDPYYGEKISELVKNITSIEYIVTENEKEAYLLENIQIKKHQPRFNVIMRDSKSYPWVALFYSEDYPRIRIIRGPEKYSKDNVYLGPYTDKKEIFRILRDLRKIFPYCSCKKKVTTKSQPCLYYQLKLCPGPCIEAVNKDDYLENIRQIELFLKGENEKLKDQINYKMKIASESQNYELAAFWRDKLQAIENSTTTQNILSDHSENKDIVSYFIDKDNKYISMMILHIREGRIINKDSFVFDLRDKIITKEHLFPSILEQFYQNTSKNLPDSIIIPKKYKGLNTFEELLRDFKANIHIRIPEPQEYGLMRIVNKNAQVLVQQKIKMEEIEQKEQNENIIVLEEAVKILNLKKIPRIIEGFDISNIEGTNATGSMVYFLDGKPYTKYYRHFNIKSKSTPDDVAMMKEVISRRYNYLLENNLELPDLILVDGGKGQLNAGLTVLKQLGIDGIPIIGLAKKNEEIYIPDEKDPLILSKNSPLLKLFQRVRDEAHRFAVRLHKKQRKKALVSSLLDDIKGVGPATRTKLLNHFGSVNNIKKASLEELTRVIKKELALEIKKVLNK